MKVLVTGFAGFIEFHAAKRLLERGDEVIGIDRQRLFRPEPESGTPSSAAANRREHRHPLFQHLRKSIPLFNNLTIALVQLGDLPDTCASTTALNGAYGYELAAAVDLGMAGFVSWQQSHYGDARAT